MNFRRLVDELKKQGVVSRGLKNSFPNWISFKEAHHRHSSSDSSNESVDVNQESSRNSSTTSLSPYLTEMTKEEATDILRDSPRKVCKRTEDNGFLKINEFSSDLVNQEE